MFHTHKYKLLTTFVLLAIATALMIVKLQLADHPSAELSQLRKQEQFLALPTPSKSSESDIGCYKKSYSNATSCSRDISLIYNDTTLESGILQKFAKQGWQEKEDTQAAGAARAKNYYQLNSLASRSPVCAQVAETPVTLFKPEGPFFLSVRFYGVSEGCRKST